MNAIQAFQFQSNQLRIEADEHGNPWFLGKDVCDILGYANHNKTLKDHCKPEGVTNRYPLQTAGGVQYPAFINEGNLYRLIIKSTKPESAPFEAWIFDEVLTALRKTGGYGIPRETQQLIQTLQAELLKKSPRTDKVRKLQRAGFSKAETAKMLGVGETTLRRETALLKRCGYALQAAGTPLDVALGGGQ